MDNDITDMIEKCKGCALVAEAPQLLSNLGQKQNNLGRGYMLILRAPLEDFYYLIVVDSYSKCAWGSQMQKTYYGDNYWIPTWTVCAVRL